MKIISGNANTALAKRICQHLNMPLTRVLASRFSEGEVRVKIEENIRGICPGKRRRGFAQRGVNKGKNKEGF